MEYPYSPLRPEQIGLWPADWDYGVSLIRGIKRMARTSAPKPAWKLAFVLKVKTMQTNVTFNTHKAVKALKSSGFNEKQAESVVETIDKAVNETVATKTDLALLATKDDLKALATKDELKVLTKTVEGIQENMATKSDLEVQGAKIDALRETVESIQGNIDKNIATKTEIANLETRMMRMMLLQTLVLVGTLGTLIFAVVKLL